jgi:hypothetical protein
LKIYLNLKYKLKLLKIKRVYWEYALHIDINTIVYLHCHQQNAMIVLVAQDGVQHPPIKFPKGSHLLQFLTCLESGLAPNGQLDPPLWIEDGKGKIFPKLRRKSMKKINVENQQNKEINVNNNNNTPTPMSPVKEESKEDFQEDDQEDFVFRIVNSKSNGILRFFFTD